MTNLARVIPAGIEVTEGIEGRSMTRTAETAGAALAAHSQASMQARVYLARTQPRDWDRVRVLLMKECRRKSFAKVARYAKPVGGKKIEGWSVRFAEVALRVLGNLSQETLVVFDSEEKRGLKVVLLDLESNTSIDAPIVIDKTVERSDPRGQVPLRVRINTEGRETFLVLATEDDLANKQGAAISKARRNNVLQLIPGDILDDCLEVVREVMTSAHAEDPEAYKKSIIDGFASLRILPDALRTYLGHSIEECTPAELHDLRVVYAAVRDGEASFASFLAAKLGGGEGTGEPTPTPPEAAPTAKPTSKAASMAEAIRNR